MLRLLSVGPCCSHAALRQLPKSFDPPQIEDQGSGIVSAQVYEGLLTYHPFARPYQLIPALAAELPTVSEDKRTYTFTLRKQAPSRP